MTDKQDALMIAAANGHAELCGELIEAGADVNRLDSDGRAPLHIAAGEGRIEVCEELIRRGADVNAWSNEDFSPGYSVLWNAVYGGHAYCAKLLLDHGAEINPGDLHDASDPATARVLIDAGANVDERDHRDDTPLHLAAGRGDDDLCRLLIESGAEVDAVNREGKTPLQVALDTQDVLVQDVCQVLIGAGAKPAQAPTRYSTDDWAPTSGQTSKDLDRLAHSLGGDGADEARTPTRARSMRL